VHKLASLSRRRSREQLAELIVFLASHQARFVTGQKITMH
jgi:NAD(P)-dependent dehydrogenase (short-subunit alcohol dehydrogenase family)